MVFWSLTFKIMEIKYHNTYPRPMPRKSFPPLSISYITDYFMVSVIFYLRKASWKISTILHQFHLSLPSFYASSRYICMYFPCIFDTPSTLPVYRFPDNSCSITFSSGVSMMASKVPTIVIEFGGSDGAGRYPSFCFHQLNRSTKK